MGVSGGLKGDRGEGTFFGVAGVVVGGGAGDGVAAGVFWFYAGEELGVYLGGCFAEAFFGEGDEFLVSEEDEEFFVVYAEDDVFLGGVRIGVRTVTWEYKI